MSRRLAVVVLAAALLASVGSPARADEGAGARDLVQGREALARRDYSGAVEHLRSAVRDLESARDGMALGDAWLQLGIAYLKGQEDPALALRAFLQSAAASPDPSTAWLWASMAAEKLGHGDEAAAFRMRAVPPPPPPAPVVEKPAPPVEKPAPAPQPQPAAAAPAQKPDAVQHFFGEAEPAKPEKAEATKDDKDSKDKKDGKKVDAIDHFFGGQQQEPSQDEGDTETKPPF